MKTFLTSLAASVLLASASLPSAVAHDFKAIRHTAIGFDAGSAALSDADRESLRDLVRDARASRGIDEVTVAAWSDQALPTAKGAQLSETSRDLAKARIDSIEKYLKSGLDVGDVDSYTMAESSNWMARTFNTNDAELKSLFSKRGAEVPVTNEEFLTIRNDGGPSKAVIVITEKKAK